MRNEKEQVVLSEQKTGKHFKPQSNPRSTTRSTGDLSKVGFGSLLGLLEDWRVMVGYVYLGDFGFKGFCMPPVCSFCFFCFFSC